MLLVNKTPITIGLITVLACFGCTNRPVLGEKENLNVVDITEWKVPWEQTRPRDPYVDQKNRVWFVGQTGDYIAVLDPKNGKFQQYQLDPGTGPHNLIVDTQDQVWYAGNRTAHIGKLDPTTGDITKYAMPHSAATDPHTLIFGNNHDIWFTVQQSNYLGHLVMNTGHVDLISVPTSNARPYGIILDEAHTPWFAEFGTNKLGTIDSMTKSVREISLPRSDARPRRLAPTSDGDVWYVDYAKGYLGRFMPVTNEISEWQTPGGEDARPYGMTVDDKDRVWYVETGVYPNRLIGFDTRTQKVISITNIKSGGGTVRHMVFHERTQTIWFGTDANTIGRVKNTLVRIGLDLGEKCSRQEETPRRDHPATGKTSMPYAEGQNFFYKYENGNGCNPQKIHHTTNEQQSHQCPAASETIGAMFETHSKGTADTRSPMLGNKMPRGTAMLETHILPGGQLIQTRDK